MKLFVYEHITSGALIDDPLPASLAHEGDEMLQALLKGLMLIADIELITLRDARLPALSPCNTICHTINNKSEFEQYFAEAFAYADSVLPIAPETDNTLTLIQQSILDNGLQLIACQPAATQLCSDKYLCHQHLNNHHLDNPLTIPAHKWLHHAFDSSTGYILKPRDGAGCVDTLFFDDQSALNQYLSAQNLVLSSLIIQPYIHGVNASLTLLCNHNECVTLALNQQHIDTMENKLQFRGCTINGLNNVDVNLEKVTKLANRIHQAIPGLWGFIGIDLIFTENAMLIIDINPRLTTAYIGLAESIGLNPAELLFSMMKHDTIPTLSTQQNQAVEVLL